MKITKLANLVVPVEGLTVASWSPGDVTQGDPCTQVHVMWVIKEFDALFVTRFKSREAVDSLIAALVENRDEVWGKEEKT